MWTKGSKPTSRYGTIKKLREQAALFSLLTSNGITTMQQLYEKVDSMNSRYYDLRGKIVSVEHRIAVLEERLSMFQQYEKYKAIHRQYAKMKPAKQEQFEQRYHAELALYDAAVRYLENLKAEGEAITPKKWRSEADVLTAQKNLQYQELRHAGGDQGRGKAAENSGAACKGRTAKGEEAKRTRTLSREKPPYRMTSIRRQVLFSEQVAVRSGASQGQHQHFILNAVDQQPIREDMTLTVSDPISGQCVILVFRICNSPIFYL